MPGQARSDVIDGWNKLSAAYQSRYRIADDEISYGPMIGGEARFGLLGDLSGRTVLDVGCGGGQNSVALARSGAKRVVALDPSAAQIAFAKGLAEDAGVKIDFREAGAEALARISGAFDVIVSFYALMYVVDLEGVFREIHRLLNPGGRFVISADHPVRIAGQWQDDVFILEDYNTPGWRSWIYDFPEQDVSAPMHRFHRRMQDWITPLLAADLRLDGLLEPTPVDPPDTFGRVSRHGLDSPLNVFSPARLSRVPGSILLWGSK